MKMKKFYSILLGAAVLFSSSNASAQQLPNVGFESWKGSGKCGKTEAHTKSILGKYSSSERQRPGDEPADWNGSSVNQKVSGFTKEQELIYKETNDMASGSCAVKMVNTYVGAFGIGSVAPGFLTFGTPWVYAVTDVDKCDGGVFGGVSFTYKPDAITGKYKRTDSNDENSYIIAYLWNGTFTSKVGEKNNPNTDRDNEVRGIFGKIATSKAGNLVAKCEYSFKSTNSGWQEITVPLEYVAGAGEPTMMNVIISGGNYWDRGSLQENTTLLADDVKFVYYSRLSALSVNGVAIDGFDSKVYNYSIPSTELPTEDQISATVMGQTATKSIAIDKEAATVTITVSNVSTDNDGQSSHTYVLQYEKAPAKVGVSTDYPGFLNVKIYDEETGEWVPIAVNENNSITITKYEDGTCDFLLPNFTLSAMELTLGDILVEGATVTVDEAGVSTYNGYVEDMPLLGGALVADVTLSGTINAEGVVNMTINVVWDGTPIECTFTTNEIIEKVGVSTDYPGYLNVNIYDEETGEWAPVAENESNSITITEYEDGTCDFLLPNFALSAMELTLGDILVEGATVEKSDDGISTYNGYVEDMPLLEGALVADVTLGGTISAGGVVEMVIDVLWDGVPIKCTFTSELSGVENVEINENVAPVYYNLQGVKVANPENGVFIKVQGSKATKVIL